MKIVKTEVKDLKKFLKKNYTVLVVTIAFTLFMVLSLEADVTMGSYLGVFFYYILLPILTALIFLNKNPLDFGLRLGDYKVWIRHVIVALLVIAGLLYFASSEPNIVDYYSGDADFKTHLAFAAVYFLGWEFIFRGFLLFGLKDDLKEGAIFVQMIPFVLLHVGKPLIETLSSIIGGLYLGYLAYKTRSFWPAYIIHVAIYLYLVALVNFQAF